MEWLKTYFQNRYFKKIKRKRQPALNFPVNLSQFGDVMILFSEESSHKGLVPLLKGKIQEQWPGKRITLLNTAKFTEPDKNRWDLLHEIASAKFLKMKKLIIFSLIDDADIIGRQIITLISDSLRIGIMNQKGIQPDWANILIQISENNTKQDHIKSAEKIISTLQQITK